MAYLEIKNYNKTFSDGFKVLNDICFNIEKGEVLSVIGSSGSGKTTLLRAINFLTDIDSGMMILDGETLYDASTGVKLKDDELRQKRLNFGLVFQSFNLFPQYNVLDNITLAPLLLLKGELKEYKKQLKSQTIKTDANAKPKKLSGSEIRSLLNQRKELRNKEILADAHSLLETVGLTEKAKAYPCELSGGQQQRVAIARALALKPKVLCFDEPTSALDPELTGEVLKVIKSLKGKDRTMIIVTHEMSFAKNVSDKVVFMSDGVIEEEGSATEVFENPKSEKLKHFLSSVVNKDGI